MELLPVANQPKQTTGSEPGGFGQLLLDLANKAARTTKEETASKGSSLPLYLILTGLVVIGFAVMGWLAVRAKRKAAQLEYQLRIKEEEQQRLVEKAQTTKSEAERWQATKDANDLAVGVQELKNKISVVQDAAIERAKTLATATTWDDLVIVGNRRT